ITRPATAPPPTNRRPLVGAPAGAKQPAQNAPRPPTDPTQMPSSCGAAWQNWLHMNPASAPYPRLVADIGGTNARFALVEAPGAAPTQLRSLRCAEHAG